MANSSTKKNQSAKLARLISPLGSVLKQNKTNIFFTVSNNNNKKKFQLL